MMFLIRLPLHFKCEFLSCNISRAIESFMTSNYSFSCTVDQALEVSAQYNYVTTLELLDIVKKQEPIKWVSRQTASAFLVNAQIFLCDQVSDAFGRYDGCLAMINYRQLCELKVDYSKYTTTCRSLKERKLKV